ncbi:hypothetical protein AKJ37_06630, partial [candidate division MSBL1 archaeon SCGC-AAA259I09]
MECFQEGVISEEETGGLSLEWGNKEIIEEMIRRVGEVEGFGRVLAKGSWRASKELGEEAEKFSQTIKKQGLPANDPRNALDWGLGYATATRGACHLKAFPFINKAVDVQFAKEELQVDDEKLLDPTTPEGIGKVVAWSENWSAALDSLGLCKFLYNYLGF